MLLYCIQRVFHNNIYADMAGSESQWCRDLECHSYRPPEWSLNNHSHCFSKLKPTSNTLLPNAYISYTSPCIHCKFGKLTFSFFSSSGILFRWQWPLPKNSIHGSTYWYMQASTRSFISLEESERAAIQEGLLLDVLVYKNGEMIGISNFHQ